MLQKYKYMADHDTVTLYNFISHLFSYSMQYFLCGLASRRTPGTSAGHQGHVFHQNRGLEQEQSSKAKCCCQQLNETSWKEVKQKVSSLKDGINFQSRIFAVTLGCEFLRHFISGKSDLNKTVLQISDKH